MRILVAIVLAGACTNSESVPVCEQDYFDACTSCARDQDCGAASQRGEVCAPDMQCWPPSELQTMTIRWTIGGQPASAATCQNLARYFDVNFEPNGLKPDGIEDSMVACADGMIVQDQVPASLVQIFIVTDCHVLEHATNSLPILDVDLPTSLANIPSNCN